MEGRGWASLHRRPGRNQILESDAEGKGKSIYELNWVQITGKQINPSLFSTAREIPESVDLFYSGMS